MISVRISHDTINNNCDFYTIEDFYIDGKSYFYAIPKNSEFEEFWKYRKSVINEKTNYILKEIFRFNNLEEIKVYDKEIFGYELTDFHEIIFEFPDEETAFYFKLKYC